MNEIIEKFSSIILHFIVIKEEITGEKEVQRCEIILTNHSRLLVYESIQRTKFKYSYHWMDATNLTIVRWDNSPHYPSISTYPHHKHVGSENNVQESHEQTLYDVLNFIKQQIQKA